MKVVLSGSNCVVAVVIDANRHRNRPNVFSDVHRFEEQISVAISIRRPKYVAKCLYRRCGTKLEDDVEIVGSRTRGITLAAKLEQQSITDGRGVKQSGVDQQYVVPRCDVRRVGDKIVAQCG